MVSSQFSHGILPNSVYGPHYILSVKCDFSKVLSGIYIWWNAADRRHLVVCCFQRRKQLARLRNVILFMISCPIWGFQHWNLTCWWILVWRLLQGDIYWKSSLSWPDGVTSEKNAQELLYSIWCCSGSWALRVLKWGMLINKIVEININSHTFDNENYFRREFYENIVSYHVMQEPQGNISSCNTRLEYQLVIILNLTG